MILSNSKFESRTLVKTLTHCSVAGKEVAGIDAGSDIGKFRGVTVGEDGTGYAFEFG